MRIGYACLALGVPDTQIRSCVRKNATEERLRELIRHNLSSLGRMLDYNIARNILLFRISSDIIPFGSSPVNTLAWDQIFAEELVALGKRVLGAGMRLSMHPGQYTVINSPHADVVARAVEDLCYHTRFLDALGLGSEHKIILHIGGVYGDRVAAVDRFRACYHTLDQAIRKRLVIENDDKMYSIHEVLEIGLAEGIPVVYDNLHHRVNPGDRPHGDRYWVDACRPTWRKEDGPQKVHYSQQGVGKRPGSHSQTIGIDEFLRYHQSLSRKDLDVMLEVKDKNLSAVKCILSTQPQPHIKYLEAEWARYKYTVLERAPEIYQEIRSLLKDKTACPTLPFYRLLEAALEREATTGGQLNAAQHVWGYFRKDASEKERARFQRALAAFRAGNLSIGALKGQLRRLAEAHGQSYLLGSIYFDI